MSSRRDKKAKSKVTKIKEESDSDHQFEEEESKRPKIKSGSKNKIDKKQKGKKKVKEGIHRFIDDQASEEDGENSEEINDQGQVYDPKDLAPKHQFNMDEFEQKQIKRQRRIDKKEARRRRDQDKSQSLGSDDSEDSIDSVEAYEAGHQNEEQILNGPQLPSVDDPKLWQVRVKRNFERIACMALMNKCMHFASEGKPLFILSATSSDNTEGWIYVEAFKEIHVKQACQGLHFILGKFLLVPQEEMPNVFESDKAKEFELKTNQWVRIRHSGAFGSDVGLVAATEDNRVWVRLIPRMEKDQSKQAPIKKRFFTKVPQCLHYQPPISRGTKVHEALNLPVSSYRGGHFYKGYQFKAFPFKQIESGPNVKPTHEELLNFHSTMQKNGQKMKANGDREFSDEGEEHAYTEIVKTMSRGGSTSYAKGDKITVVKGDLTSLKGVVISIEDGQVLFKAMNCPELNRPLQVDLSMIAKYFEPSDQVRITEGKYKGETGRVLDVDDNRSISVVLDKTQQEIKVTSSFLKLKSDSDTNVEKTSIGAPATRNKYAALDLVNYHGSKHGGLVLQVHEDYLKVLNEQSKIDNVKVSDVDKCIPPPRRGGNIQGQDRKGNNLVHDSMVKVVEGPYKGLIAPIKHSFKNYLFLWHKDYVQQNGIFVENQRNVEILGAEFMKPSSEAAVANQNRLVKDKLIGEEVIICGGVFKGHRGRVCKLDDKQAIVELSSQCKKIAIKKELVIPLKNPEDAYAKRNNNEGQGGRSAYGNQSVYGGATVYDGGKTPGGINTPCHPQSAWGPNEQNEDENNFRPGSQHFQDHMGQDNYNHTPGHYGNQFKSEQ